MSPLVETIVGAVPVVLAFIAGLAFTRASAHTRAAAAMRYLSDVELVEPITHVHVVRAVDLAAGVRE